jgi:mono/diheme cytochrome c family protein
MVITIQYDDLAPRQQRVFAPGANLVALNEVIQAAIAMTKGDTGMPESAYSGKCSRCHGVGCTWCEGTGKSVFFQEGVEIHDISSEGRI